MSFVIDSFKFAAAGGGGGGVAPPGDIGLYAGMSAASMSQLTSSAASGYKVNPQRSSQIDRLGTAVDLFGGQTDVAMRAVVMSTAYAILADSGWVTVTKGSPAAKDWYDVYLPAPYQLTAGTQVIFAFTFRKTSDLSNLWAGLLSNGSYTSSYIGTLFSDGSGNTTIHFNASFGAPDAQSDYRGSFRTHEL